MGIKMVIVDLEYDADGALQQYSSNHWAISTNEGYQGAAEDFKKFYCTCIFARGALKAAEAEENQKAYQIALLRRTFLNEWQNF